jgi:hypothetical protein
MAYSEVGDLLTGNIPTPDYLSPQKYVDDAADEIDSKIGFIYKTPVVITEENPVGTPNPVVRPVRLLLKRLNNFLASGRLLMAASAGGEDDRVHAYGWSLVQDATLALMQISEGKIPLEGVEPVEGDDDGVTVTAPLFYNEDLESNVSAFYDRIVNPDFQYFPVDVRP